MEALLLCDEVWVMSPDRESEYEYNNKQEEEADSTRKERVKGSNSFYFYTTKDDCDYAFITCLEKELLHMPQPSYIQLLHSNHPLATARFNAIHWLLQSQCHFTLSFQTIFNAVNYLDRFISMNQCHGWKHWMFELLSLACLSIASKFSETAPPPFHEMQEGLDNYFQVTLIQRMELTLLKAIGWTLNCATPYSYVELITWEISLTTKPHLVHDITSRLIQLLATSLLDYKFLAFRPSIIATSTLRCLVTEWLPSACDVHVAHITSLIPQPQRENLIKCDKLLMEEIFVERYEQLHDAYVYYPSSPVTVLTNGRVELLDQQVDFSLFFKMPPTLDDNSPVKPGDKRKREED